MRLRWQSYQELSTKKLGEGAMPDIGFETIEGQVK